MVTNDKITVHPVSSIAAMEKVPLPSNNSNISANIINNPKQDIKLGLKLPNTYKYTKNRIVMDSPPQTPSPDHSSMINPKILSFTRKFLRKFLFFYFLIFD